MARRKSTVVKVAEEDKIITEEISIRSLFPAHLKYRGRSSGQLYEWSGAGSIVSVLKEDAQELLSKRIGSRPCCGQSGEGNLLFETVQ